MITTRLQGGLGNQLFEYAFGRAIASKNNAELVLDVSQYAEDPRRHYGLDAFAINARVATPDEVSRFVGKSRFMKKLKLLFPSGIVHEPHFAFYPKALNAKDPCYLDGYWQSELYFKPIESAIRNELQLKDGLSAKAREVEKMMQACDSVSIHVRRGDYLNGQFFTLSPNYYRETMEEIQKTVSKPRYFVFSDDTAWTHEYLNLPSDTYFVSEQNLPDYEELVLMGRCKHHIIANSSFSWWGAWLNATPKKCVIAPSRWFNLDVHDIRDLVPPDWFTIAVS